jgi:hypothetical protein
MIRIPAIALVLFTGAGGQSIEINSKHVVALRTPSKVPGGANYFGPGINCLINTVDGKFHAVTEDCVTVRRKVEEQR